ncbi:MAG TPA: hypothetical protein VNK95_18505 [Caldilineaceae bacterium]|nr:hypothetical protein [Caldilineaceae bacterium]
MSRDLVREQKKMPALYDSALNVLDPGPALDPRALALRKGLDGDAAITESWIVDYTTIPLELTMWKNAQMQIVE